MIDLKRVIAAKYVLFGVTEESRGLEVYLEAGFKIDILPEETEVFLKAWEEYDKARGTEAILIPDLEDQEAPESFGGLRYDCFSCGRENILNRENEGNLKRPSVIGENPKSIFLKCCYCDRAERKYLKDFK